MKKIVYVLLFISSILHSQCIQKYSAGDWSTFAIKDGVLYAWGQVSISETYQSHYIGSNLPRNIGMDTDWSSVSVGSNTMVAKKNDGTIWTYSLLCIGGSQHNGYPADFSSIGLTFQIGTETDWDKIYLGGHHTLALKTNGTLWSWGLNQYGETGNLIGGLSDLPVQVGSASDWVKIYAGVSHSLAIKSDGSLWAWGLGNYGQIGDWNETSRNTPVYVGTTNDWLNATAGSDCSFGIKTNGTLWAWGRNNNGQLGIGNHDNKNTPVQVGTINNWLKVVSYSNAEYYESQTIALKTDGTIWKREGMYFIQIGTENNWQDIDMGVSHFIASKTDGTVWTWGDNYSGQLGLGSTWGTFNTPQLVNCSQWVALGINDIEPAQISAYIYPNPAKNEFTFTNLKDEYDFQIINSLGQTIQHGTAMNNTKIDVGDLSKGIYYVKINQETIKLIKY